MTHQHQGSTPVTTTSNTQQMQTLTPTRRELSPLHAAAQTMASDEITDLLAGISGGYQGQGNAGSNPLR